MPRVSVTVDLDADPDHVWEAVQDVESYADRMESVRWVRILEQTSETVRRTSWSVLLRGSILEWEELESVDKAERTITFQQVSGDLQRFEGSWCIREGRQGGSQASLEVDFEIGIPLLAQMLEPIATDALRDNSRSMLQALDHGR